MESKLKITELNKNEIKSFYIIKSNDSFIIDTTIKILKMKAKIVLEEINTTIFDEDNYDYNLFLNAYLQMPFSDEYRLVILKNVKEKKMDNFLSLLENPNPTTILLIVDSLSQFDVLTNKITEINSELSYKEQESIIFNKLKKSNKKISVDASKLLIEKCNNNLSKLSNEIVKLIAYNYEQEIIDINSVENVVKADEDYQVFALMNLLAEKKGDSALKMLIQMLEAKEDLNALLGIIYSNFRRIFLTKSSGMSDAEIAKQIGVKPYSITKARQHSNKFPIVTLKKIMYLCQKLDYQIKTGEISSLNALYILVFSILGN